jgi:hypothetical protein
VRGEVRGSVWGTDTYTGDSALAAASVHAGTVALGEIGVVKVTVVAPLSQYHGSTRHGIVSHSYGFVTRVPDAASPCHLATSQSDGAHSRVPSLPQSGLS